MKQGNISSVKYSGWSGVNNSDNDENIDVTEMSDCRNFLFTTFGEIFLRRGLQLPQELLDDSIMVIYDVWHNQVIYQSEIGLYLFRDGQEDQFIAALSTAEPIAYAHCSSDRKLYFVSEEDALFSWDGFAISRSKDETPYTEIYGNVLCWYQNHMFLSNKARFGTGSQDETKVFISNLGDPTTWSENDWLPSSGEGEMVGMIELGNHVLVCLKTHSIFFATGYGLNSWELTDDNDATTNIDNSVGCAGRQAYCRVGNEIWFMDDQKNIRVIYQTDFDPYRKTYRSEKIKSWIDEISNSLFDQTQMLYFDDKVWIFAPDITGEKRIILIFDILAARRAKLKPDGTMGEAWTRFDGDYWNVTGACVRYQGGMPSLTISNNNYLMTYGGTTDQMGDEVQQQPIEAYAITKNDDFGKYEYVKNFKLFFGKAEIDNESDVCEVLVSIDDEEEASIGKLLPSGKGMVLRNNEETIGNATLDAFDLGIYNEATDDDALGYNKPKKTKLRYDAQPNTTEGTVIKHIFKASGTGQIKVSKINSTLQVKNVR